MSAFSLIPQPNLVVATLRINDGNCITMAICNRLEILNSSFVNIFWPNLLWI